MVKCVLVALEFVSSGHLQRTVRPGVCILERRYPPEEVITEENIREVYGVDCKVVNTDGHLMVVLGGPLTEDNDLIDDKGGTDFSGKIRALKSYLHRIKSKKQ